MFQGYDICASVTFSLIIIHDAFRMIHNHGSIHINVEVYSMTVCTLTSQSLYIFKSKGLQYRDKNNNSKNSLFQYFWSSLYLTLCQCLGAIQPINHAFRTETAFTTYCASQVSPSLKRKQYDVLTLLGMTFHLSSLYRVVQRKGAV